MNSGEYGWIQVTGLVCMLCSSKRGSMVVRVGMLDGFWYLWMDWVSRDGVGLL